MFVFLLNVALGANEPFPPPPTNTFSLWHLSDLHYDPYYQPGSVANCVRHLIDNYPCCRNSSDHPLGERRDAGKYGDLNCDSPLITLNLTFDWLASQPPPTYVLATGDDPDHADLTQSVSGNLRAIELITNQLARLKTRVFPALGNHDAFPIDQLALPPANRWLMQPVAAWWRRWLPGAAEQAMLRKGGFYVTRVRAGLQLFALETIYFDRHNAYLHGVLDALGQLDALEATLAAGRAAGDAVWIIGHIAPSQEEATAYYATRYLAIVGNYTDVVRAQFFGHSHKDSIALTWPANTTWSAAHGPSTGAEPSGVLYIVPSVTPFATGGMNPSVRALYMDASSFAVVDYVTFHMDLAAANQRGDSSFRQNYRASAYAGGAPVSPAAWRRFLLRAAANATLFADYYDTVFNGRYRPLSLQVPCTDAHCRLQFLCSQFVADPVRAQQCTDHAWLKIQ